MTNVVATIWTPPLNREGEYTATNNPNIDSEAGLDLITESSNNIIQEDSSLTLITGTAWTSSDGS